jgi:EAL domain-containing protein (putative c-di-GMP-specific phosphodiesterase class I)
MYTFAVTETRRSVSSSMESDRRDEAIVSLTIEPAHRPGLQVVAEGIETTAHLERLRAAGCDFGQGHLLGRPLPGDQLVPTARALGTSWAALDDGEVVPLRRAG